MVTNCYPFLCKILSVPYTEKSYEQEKQSLLFLQQNKLKECVCCLHGLHVQETREGFHLLCIEPPRGNV